MDTDEGKAQERGRQVKRGGGEDVLMDEVTRGLQTDLGRAVWK